VVSSHVLLPTLRGEEFGKVCTSVSSGRDRKLMLTVDLWGRNGALHYIAHYRFERKRVAYLHGGGSAATNTRQTAKAAIPVPRRIPALLKGL